MSQLLTKEYLVEDGLVSLTNAMVFLSVSRSTLYEFMDKGVRPPVCQDRPLAADPKACANKPCAKRETGCMATSCNRAQLA